MFKLNGVEITPERLNHAIGLYNHNRRMIEKIQLIKQDHGEPMDNIRVVITGSFCEQPPIGMLKSIEMAGCYIVDDDLMLGSRWTQGDVDENTVDPLGAIVTAFLTKSPASSAVYDVGNPKGARLVKLVRQREADGVIFCAASFCDPALLDRPELQRPATRKAWPTSTSSSTRTPASSR
ncbi:MAG: 2-hydroxyacyl-CoA dehydratase [Flavobacteriales bacterium]|nr:2-hydroxyacyl-CoA dehydratase [Flavobacteriales bacterium]